MTPSSSLGGWFCWALAEPTKPSRTPSSGSVRTEIMWGSFALRWKASKVRARVGSAHFAARERASGDERDQDRCDADREEQRVAHAIGEERSCRRRERRDELREPSHDGHPRAL